jgi:glycosyltransferase involved in cell wall biosynthesis
MASVRPDRPFLTVAIPAFNNGQILALTLESFTRQTVPSGRFEVVVVDDGSDPPLKSIVDRFATSLAVTYLRHDSNRGRSVTRNRALHAARGDVVLFVDADNYAHPDLVRRHWDFHSVRRGRPGVLVGRSLNIDWAALGAIQRGELPGDELLGDYREDLRDYIFAAPHRRRDWARAPWLFAFTCNISADRESLLAVGGFDEQLVRWGAEDCELFYRVFHHHAGAENVFELSDDAVCYHLPHFRSWAHLADMLAENQRYLAGKHPRYDFEMYRLMGHGGIAMKRIMWYGDAIEACRKLGLARVAGLPAAYRQALRRERCLVIGLGGADIPLAPGSATFDHDAPLTGDNLHLLGFKTPFGDRHFERSVNVDLWRFLTPEDLGGFLTEAFRVADRVDLVCTDERIEAASVLPLPFVEGLAYVGRMLEAEFDVDIAHSGGCATLALARKPG